MPVLFTTFECVKCLGEVYPVCAGSAVLIDAVSCFHHSQQAGRSATLSTPALPTPQLPDYCALEVEDTPAGVYWIVRNKDTREVVSRTLEEDIRFSVSCKFHIFHNEDEIKKYEDHKNKLTAENIIEVLVEDLIAKRVLPEECSPASIPLYKLAPILVQEYIQPLAPTSTQIQQTWTNYFEQGNLK